MCSIYLRRDDVDEAIIEPIERSIPPEMITIAWPQAAKHERQRVDRERLHVERPPLARVVCERQ